MRSAVAGFELAGGAEDAATTLRWMPALKLVILPRAMRGCRAWRRWPEVDLSAPTTSTPDSVCAVPPSASRRSARFAVADRQRRPTPLPPVFLSAAALICASVRPSTIEPPVLWCRRPLRRSS